ncbi:MAG: hypothetical protein KIT18_00695 [Burkholderiales bacterium]|nr:hypothetical protein [Burkholderiales bacterium]
MKSPRRTSCARCCSDSRRAAERGPCFASPQIKRCRGACTGAESAARHALRVAQALQPWPFRGRVGIRETGVRGATTELHVLDRWCYLGTARSEQELHELNETRRPPAFDPDVYKSCADRSRRAYKCSRALPP